MWVQVPPTGSGSLVFKIDPLAPAAQVLKEHDVVMEIEGVPIADDGTVEFRNEERVEFSHIVRSKHIGGSPPQGRLQDSGARADAPVSRGDAYIHGMSSVELHAQLV